MIYKYYYSISTVCGFVLIVLNKLKNLLIYYWNKYLSWYIKYLLNLDHKLKLIL